jgi:hypothetical protein
MAKVHGKAFGGNAPYFPVLNRSEYDADLMGVPIQGTVR